MASESDDATRRKHRRSSDEDNPKTLPSAGSTATTAIASAARKRTESRIPPSLMSKSARNGMTVVIRLVLPPRLLPVRFWGLIMIWRREKSLKTIRHWMYLKRGRIPILPCCLKKLRPKGLKTDKNDKNLVRKKHKDLDLERTSGVESVANGYVHDCLRDDLPHKEYSQQNEDYSWENIPRNRRNEVLAEDGRKSHRGLLSSPSLGTRHDRAQSQSCPRSPDQSRGRAGSQSGFGDSSLADYPKEYDSYHSKRRYRSDSDDVRVIDSGRDYKHASKDSLRKSERELSAYSRHISRVDSHHSRETWDIDREGSGDVDRYRRKDKDRDREGARERERERERESERARERDRAREKGTEGKEEGTR